MEIAGFARVLAGAKLLLALVILFSVTYADVPAEVWLEVPQLQARVEANSEATIATPEFDGFVIHIAKQPNQVNYGSISAKINTESANIIMTTAGTPEGIVCRFDLARRGGFRLAKGRNSVELSFFDQWGRLHYSSFVLATPEAAPTAGAQASTPERFGAEKFAVVVGISRYRYSGPGLPAVRFADADARAFRDFLQSPEGGQFRAENIRLLLNDEAGTQNLHAALFDFLGRARPEDLVVIYFAGHGIADPKDARNLYLLTSDANPNNVGGSGLSMDELQQALGERVKAHRVITLVDICHSLGVGRDVNTPPVRQNNLVNQYVARFAGEQDRAVITASDVSQLSQESEQWGGGHGVFTYYLLRGLGGDADLNKDGTVTAGELFRYVRDQVYKETMGQQRPVALPGLAENLPLAAKRKS
jgi:hypothetical protein